MIHNKTQRASCKETEDRNDWAFILEGIRDKEKRDKYIDLLSSNG